MHWLRSIASSPPSRADRLADNPVHLTRAWASRRPANDADAAGLLRRAEVARSVARNSGGDRAVVFEPAMQEAVQTRFALESDLRRAIDQAEFVLNYQPIVTCSPVSSSGRRPSSDGTIRPTRIAPTVFIPLAEETGLINEIGTWVLRTACTEVARWAALSPGGCHECRSTLGQPARRPQFAWTVRRPWQTRFDPNWVTSSSPRAC